jgi:hypothetical protein
MSGIRDVELAVVKRFRSLPLDGQSQTLAYTETLSQEFNVKSSDRATTLRQILALSISERHEFLTRCIPGIVADFEEYPELREFSMLDGLDWEPEDD